MSNIGLVVVCVGVWGLSVSFDISLEGVPEPIQLVAGMSTIIVGANGSGKTRLAMECERKLGKAAHRISAQRMLALDPAIEKIGEKVARNHLRYGYDNPAAYGGVEQSRAIKRWGNGGPSFILNDAGSLLQILLAEQANVGVAVNDEAAAGLPVTSRETLLRKLKEIFHRVLPTRRIMTTADDITVVIEGDDLECEPYSIASMSDGEKAVFYIIGQVLVAESGSVFIMDEPEIHVHRSILGRLWDELEAARPNCAFLLITHDLEFAASRAGRKYVVRSYMPTTGWVIDDVPEAEGFSEEIVTLILGSRKPILFVEGEMKDSLDIAFYRACYPNWTVIPRGGCESVIHSVASMRRNAAFTRIACAGLVDADARDAKDRKYLEDQGVSVLPVAEIENLLLLPAVSKAILEKNDFSGEELERKLLEIKSSIFADAKLKKNADAVVLGYCRRRIDQILKRVDFSNEAAIDDLASCYERETQAVDVKSIAAEFQQRIDNAIAAEDLPALLAIYDRKDPLLAIAARLRTGHVKEFKAWVIRAVLSKDDDRLRVAISGVLPTPSTT